MRASPKIINFPKISDPRGNLTFIEGFRHIPFEIKRAYWIYDVPGGVTRGAHAFKLQHECIIAMSGSFDVLVDVGSGRKKKFSLNRSYHGLYIPAGCWRQMLNFSTNSFALVLTSTLFDENDYIRDYDEYKRFISKSNVSVPELYNLTQIHNFSSSELGKSTVFDCHLLELDKNHRTKGNITVVQNGGILPFDIKRAYYLYDVPGGEERGGHGHKVLNQILVAASGSFDVVLDDGVSKQTVSLNRPYQALIILPGIWRELKNFSSGSCCLVLASHVYDESEYIRDYNEFKALKST